MNEDFVYLGTIIDSRESNPERYERWDRACREQLGCGIDAIAGEAPIMVPEHGFAYHAKFMAEESGVDTNKWPHNLINWEAAAEELKDKYGRIEVDGVAYYYGGEYQHHIIYFAGFAEDLFSTHESHMDFCEWARSRLVSRFRDHNVVVRTGLGLARIVHIPGEDEPRQWVTDDDNNRDAIFEFCENLYQRWLFETRTK